MKKNLKEINSDYCSRIPVAQRYPVVCVNTINFGFQYENICNSKAVKQIHTSCHENCSTSTRFAFFKTFAFTISKFYRTSVSPRAILTERNNLQCWFPYELNVACQVRKNKCPKYIQPQVRDTCKASLKMLGLVRHSFETVLVVSLHLNNSFELLVHKTERNHIFWLSILQSGKWSHF